jgi:spermidine synthase
MRVWLLLYFLSGFMALGLEIVWFRLLGVTLKSTSYTFALLLTLYLLGVGAGSLLGRWLARRSRDPMRGFLRLQACIPVYAALSVFALTMALDHLDVLLPARQYLGHSEPIAFAFDFGELPADKLGFYLGIPALLILPPTLLMGISFPYLQRAVQSDLGQLGRRVGWLQACNILGCTAGGAVVGLVLLDRIGTSGTLATLALLGFVFAGLSVWRSAGNRLVRLALALATCLIAAWIVPAPARLWASLHGTTVERIIHAEDGSGLAVLRADTGDFRKNTTVFANGLGQSWIPYGHVHTWLGLMPALLHPAPKSVAVIGLGSGDTAFALACRPETTSVYAIEIMGKQLATLRELHERAPYGGIESLLTDPRMIHVHADGRRFIMHGDRKFDIIEADALRPNSAYSGSLFSREYFELLKQHLAKGGFAVTWAPTERTSHTFLSVFPHVVQVDPMLIGSNEPIAFDPEVVRARGASEPVRAWFTRAGIDVVPMVEEMLKHLRPTPRLAGPPPDSLLNTDLFPRDELRAR